MGVSDFSEEKCRAAILHDNMDISRLIVNAQQIEDTRFRKKTSDDKRIMSNDAGYSKGKLEIQDKPKFKKRFCNKVPSNAPSVNKGRVSNPNPQGGSGGGFYFERPSCEKWCKKHKGKGLVCMVD